MRRDNRLSRMLHVLIHMDDVEEPMTSDHIAMMLGTNPVVVRRTMAGLRELGYVQSEKGHGGGWRLTRPLNQMTLADVYRALREPPVFALGLSDDQPSCLVEQAVNTSLTSQLEQARRQLIAGFEEVKLSDIADDFRKRLDQAGFKQGVCRAEQSA